MNLLIIYSLRNRIQSKTNETSRWIKMIDESIENGFQIATNQGPLCAEPVIGMAFFIETITIEDEETLQCKLLYLKKNIILITFILNYSKHITNNRITYFIFKRCNKK